MKVSQLLSTTRRKYAGDSDVVSHGLLERAGYIRQLSSGIFNYLHLGLRSLRKIENILREEMDRIGGVEITMPVVHPAEIWRQTGRYDEIDDSLVRFQDRAERDHVLAMTHEEVVSWLAQKEITTYRQLPKLVYQIQTKFRDELRPRAGLIRVREFVMKDSYSLDTTEEGLQTQYEAHYDAYYRMFARMGLPVSAILSDVGMMGGSMAHEYMYLTEIGEDTIFICNHCGYKANKEVGSFTKEILKGDDAEMEKVHTPGMSTIEDLANFLKLKTSDLGKMVFFMGHLPGEEEEKLIAAVVRGDLEVNQQKLKSLIRCGDLRAATPAEISAAGAVAGYGSPLDLNREKALVVADDIVTGGIGLTLGANEEDYHIKNVQYGRDYTADVTGDIVSAYDGASCPRCQKELSSKRGVEAGNIFQLGTKYSLGMGALFTDDDGKDKPIIMGSYGIGVGRALACLAEHFHDKEGLKLPISVAPFHVCLIAIKDNDEITQTADDLYAELGAAGIEVLYDEREMKVASPGVKFKDADLRGIPIHVVVSSRSISNGGVELKLRGTKDPTYLEAKEVLTKVQGMIAEQFGEIATFVSEQPTWESEKQLWKKD